MLTRGEKCIIYLLNNNKSKLSKLRLVKLMFLVSKRISLYYFVPYKYGPFSIDNSLTDSHKQIQGHGIGGT